MFSHPLVASLHRPLLPFAAALALLLCSALHLQAHWLIGLMLFLPLLDRDWRAPRLQRSPVSLMVAALFIGLLLWQPQRIEFALATLLLAALPEEWFFRAYLLQRAGATFRANVIVSLVFSLAHGLAFDWVQGALVFLPSLLYGYVYQKRGDLLLVVLLHALSNLVHAIFLAETLPALLGR